MKLIFLSAIVTLGVVNAAKLTQDHADAFGAPRRLDDRAVFPSSERALARQRVQKKLAQQKGYESVDPQSYIDWNDPFYQNFDWNADYYFDKDLASNSDYFHGYYTGVMDGARLADADYDYNGYFNIESQDTWEQDYKYEETANNQTSSTESYDYQSSYKTYYYNRDGKYVQEGDSDFSWEDYSDWYYRENASSYSYTKNGEYIDYNSPNFSWDDFYASYYDQYYYYYNSNGELISYSNPAFDWSAYYRTLYYYTDKQGVTHYYGDSDFDWSGYYATQYSYVDASGNSHNYGDADFTWEGYYCYAYGYTEYCY
ncbi:hypothetical protein FGO68_gene5870 [Halteria grandinella]|uniref:Uncharacterized protein n=1 Tax=Halteria grandinella TaxID=5974 RepID=A0A8J8NN10_HALGN|nr:hypothetical protein FGO68_gene5870 [Halteria grandinella]